MACTDGIKRPCFNPTMSKGGLPSAFCLQHKCLLNTKKFAQGETVVVGIAIEEVPKRTIYSFQMDFNLYVNLDEPAIVINHSCNPNTGVRNNQFGGYDFVALHDIEAGEEISWDYETTEYESIAVQRCLCGSLSCRGKTLGFKFREQMLRDRYGEYIADYLKN